MKAFFAKRSVIAVLVTVGIGYAFTSTYLRNRKVAPVVEEEKFIAPELTARAEVRPLKEGYAVVIKGGRLDRILKPAGSEVQEQDIIAVVDETTTRTQLESALSRFKLAQTNFNRIDRLFRSGAVSREEYDDVKSTFTVRTAELKGARQELDNSLVRSPLTGVISYVAYAVGDVTPDGARVAIVEDRQSYLLRVSLPNRKRDEFGAKVLVKLPEGLGEVEGDLRKIGQNSDGPLDAVIEIRAAIPDRFIGRWIDITVVGLSGPIASLSHPSNIVDIVPLETKSE